MGRPYSISTGDVSVSASQDLINITATAAMAFDVLRVVVGQRSLATNWEAKPLRLRRMPATVTAGSGGSSLTPRRGIFGDAAPTITAHGNDTTPMTTGGTAEDLMQDMFVFFNGLLWVMTPREKLTITISQGLALNLPTAPSGASNMSATVWVEEIL